MAETNTSSLYGCIKAIENKQKCMKEKLLQLCVFVFLCAQITTATAQITEIKKFEGTNYFKELIKDPDFAKKIENSNKYITKADAKYADLKKIEDELMGYKKIALLSQDKKAKASALKKITKLNKKYMDLLDDVYDLYSDGNTLRTEAYWKALPKTRYDNKPDMFKTKGWSLEAAANSTKKLAVDKRLEATKTKGDFHKKLVLDANDLEQRALSSIVDTHTFLNDKVDYINNPNTFTRDSLVGEELQLIAGFYYTIHIAMFNDAQANEASKIQVRPLLFDKSLKGIVQYSAGVYKTYQAANIDKDSLLQLGFQGAYVVAYNNNAKVYIDEARKIEVDQKTLFAAERRVIFPYIQQYQANKVKPNIQVDSDLNYYQSQESVITNRLPLNAAEREVLYQATQTEKSANNIMLDIDKRQEEADKFRQAEYLSTDPNKQSLYRERRVMLDMQIFVDKIQATQMYVEVNTARHNIYNNYLSKMRKASESPAAMRGEEFEQNAESMFAIAKGLIADSRGLDFASEKYLSLMEANQMLLQSIESQETAFSIYFNLLSDDDIKKLSSAKSIENEETVSEAMGKTRAKLIVVDTYFYTKHSPQPKKLTDQKGICFRIELGMFTNYPKDEFGGLSPVIVEKLKGLRQSRCLVGNFKTIEGAREALPLVKNKGYKRSSIVAYDGGRRTDEAQAYISAKQAIRNYDEVAKEEIAYVRNQSSEDVYVQIADIKVIDITKTDGLIYSVQLGIYSAPLSAKELKITDNIYIERITSGAIRYTKGNFSSKEAALNERKRLLDQGFSDAFVVAFFNGKKTELNEIGAIKTRSVELKTSSATSIIFRVQVATLRSLTPEINVQFDKIKQDYPLYTQLKENGLTSYSLGEYVSYQDAQEAQKQLATKGFADSFIVPYKDNKQILMSLALKLAK
jgi:hypothetical protein